MRIRLERGPAGTYLLLAGSGETRLFQADWDFPGLAAAFGWEPCRCGATDGTVDCAHRRRSEMIAEAWDFLAERIGAELDDPGYFA